MSKRKKKHRKPDKLSHFADRWKRRDAQAKPQQAKERSDADADKSPCQRCEEMTEDIACVSGYWLCPACVEFYRRVVPNLSKHEE